jgi:hypothetical protein
VTAIVCQDERGRWCVRYRDGDYVGTYTADSEADAQAFAASPERQHADRAFAVVKFRARTGR